jgi:protein SCO1/2
MSWRLASRLSVVVSVVLVILVLLVIWHGTTKGEGTSSLQGTNLGKVAAPGFRLVDQFGKRISLSQFHGHPVVLTFLYTHCPDVCPLIADKLHLTLEKLGSKSAQVGVIAVSTDPQGDDQAAAYQFSTVHHLLDQWHFLIGTHAELSPIWGDYHVSAAPVTSTTASPGAVSHTTAIYVIDKQGRERAYLGEDFAPASLVSDLQMLLSE